LYLSLEFWSFFERDPLTINILDPLGALIEKKLGRNLIKAESFQMAIEAGELVRGRTPGPGRVLSCGLHSGSGL
jgi:predicted cupin superfamily sugar epimerase